METTLNWKPWVERFRRLGYSRIFLLLAILLALVSLTAPLWSITLYRDSANYSTTDFTSTATTTQTFTGGLLDTTTIQGYGAPLFPLRAIAGAMQASYVVVAIYAVLLAVIFAVYSRPFGQRLSPIGHLAVSLVVVAVAFLALLYPIFVLPSQAASNLGISGITGYFGSSPVNGLMTEPAGAVSGGISTATWGAGAGWWVLLAGVVLGILGGIFPYLTAMFRPLPPPPAGWRPGP